MVTDPSVADIPDKELLRRVLRGLAISRQGSRARPVPLWDIVKDKFLLGRTYACQLCERFEIDPDTKVKP